MSEQMMIAHREWAHRPPDQRFQSIDALQAAVERRRELSHEVKVATKAIRLEPTGHGGIEVADTGARLTHWSFGQAAGLGSAPAGFLRELPAPMAADVLNHRLQNADREALQVYAGADEDGGGVAIRAFTSDRYGRIPLPVPVVCSAMPLRVEEALAARFGAPGSPVEEENDFLLEVH